MNRMLLLISMVPLIALAQDQKTLSSIAADPGLTEQIIQELGPADKCSGLMFASQILLQRGDLESADRFLIKAGIIAEAEGGKNPSLIGRCTLLQGSVVVHHGGAGTTQSNLLSGQSQARLPRLGSSAHLGSELADLSLGLKHSGPHLECAVSSINKPYNDRFAWKFHVFMSLIHQIIENDP